MQTFYLSNYDAYISNHLYPGVRHRILSGVGLDIYKLISFTEDAMNEFKIQRKDYCQSNSKDRQQRRKYLKYRMILR